MEIIDAPPRGSLPGLVREFRQWNPDAVIAHVGHDDGCPAVEGGDWRECSCELVELHVEGPVNPRVVW